MESLLLITVRGFRHVAEELQERVHSILPALRFGVSPVELRDLLECKRTVEDCVYSGRSLQSAITALLSEELVLLSRPHLQSWRKMRADTFDV